jgi:hypothetical protein
MPEAIQQDIQNKVEYGSDSLQDSALPTSSKIKRTRKAWVYKSDYDHLAFKYSLLKWVSIVLVVGLLITMKLAL